MDRKPVSSSNIVSVGFDPQASELEIEFTSGGVYRYFDVPMAEYVMFVSSKSLGRHFAAFIKPQFKCKRVELLPVLVEGAP